jgi:hypothetical protein
MNSDIQDRLRNDEAFHAQVFDWLTAHGIDPRTVPMSARASIADGKLTIPVKIASVRGSDVIEPFEDQVATSTKTVPVIVEPNDDVKLWLVPRCESCGR